MPSPTTPGVFRRAVPPGVRLGILVKANGYGHGMLLAARAAVAGGADQLMVVSIDEALGLRACRHHHADPRRVPDRSRGCGRRGPRRSGSERLGHRLCAPTAGGLGRAFGPPRQRCPACPRRSRQRHGSRRCPPRRPARDRRQPRCIARRRARRHLVTPRRRRRSGAIRGTGAGVRGRPRVRGRDGSCAAAAPHGGDRRGLRRDRPGLRPRPHRAGLLRGARPGRGADAGPGRARRRAAPGDDRPRPSDPPGVGAGGDADRVRQRVDHPATVPHRHLADRVCRRLDPALLAGCHGPRPRPARAARRAGVDGCRSAPT